MAKSLPDAELDEMLVVYASTQHPRVRCVIEELRERRQAMSMCSDAEADIAELAEALKTTIAIREALREQLAAAELRESIWLSQNYNEQDEQNLADASDETDQLREQNAKLREALRAMQSEFAAEHQYCGWREDMEGLFCSSCDAPDGMPHQSGCEWWIAYEPSVALIGTHAENVVGALASVKGEQG